VPSVKLSREWNDPEGQSHPVGAVLDVDDVTAGRLQEEGVAAAEHPSAGFVGGGTFGKGPSGGGFGKGPSDIAFRKKPKGKGPSKP
jgi:hypothetical protein